MLPVEIQSVERNRRWFGSGRYEVGRFSLVYGLRARLGLCAFSYPYFLHARSALDAALLVAQKVERDSKKRLPLKFSTCDASISKSHEPCSCRKCCKALCGFRIVLTVFPLEDTGAFMVGSGRATRV